MAARRTKQQDDNDIPLLDRTTYQRPSFYRPSAPPNSRINGLLDAFDTSIRQGTATLQAVHGTQTHKYDRLGSPAPNHDESRHPRSSPTWLPYTLRWPYLLTLLLTTLLLLGTIIVLHWFSHNHKGLGKDDGQSILLFGWRFVPTLVAVAYSLLFTMIVEDVKRTEPWARLASKNGGNADATVLQAPGAWWNALADGFSRKKNGGRCSWPLITSVIGLLFALFIISPLSAVLLAPQDVAISRSSAFHRMRVLGDGAEPLDFGDQLVPRFRTISNLLQNITTSAWITNEFVALPVWPAVDAEPPLDALLGHAPETWEVETTVFKTELQCSPLELTSKAWYNVTTTTITEETSFNSSNAMGSMVLTQDNGCTVGLAVPNASYFATFGGASWASLGDFALGKAYAESYGSALLVNSSHKCSGDETVIISTAWLGPWDDGLTANSSWRSDLRVVGQNCLAHYYAANVSVTIDMDADGSYMHYNKDDFESKKSVIDPSYVRVDRFQQLFLSREWATQMVVPRVHPVAGGPSAPLAGRYNFAMSDVINDSELVEELVRVKQRYFGEALLSSLSNSSTRPSQTVDGSIVTTQTRIMVSPAVSYTLEVALFLNAVLVAVLYFVTRPSRRALGIKADPAKVSTVAMLFATHSFVRHAFRTFDILSPSAIRIKIREARFWAASQYLFSSNFDAVDEAFVGDTDGANHRMTLPTRWRPLVLRRRTVAALTLILVLITTAIVVLHAFSERSGLYQRALVFRADVTISGAHISTFAPYSIVPTLLAVLIGLWWSALETEFRTVQPFLAMTKHNPSAGGLNLSYQSSFLIWSALKALFRRHWLLSMVSMGAFLSQVFTISMSALWHQEYGNHITTSTLTRSFEARNVPHLSWRYYSPSQGADGEVAEAVLADVYGELKTTWLNGAVIQLTLNGSQPPWSADGWGFIPVDLSSLKPDESTTITNDANRDFSRSSKLVLRSSASSARFITSALRGQLLCSPYQSLSNISTWLTPQDFTSSSVWNNLTVPDFLTSGYTLGIKDAQSVLNLLPEAETGQFTTVLNSFGEPQCCVNKTDGDYNDAVIAYWSKNQDFDSYSSSSYFRKQFNLTVKWIHGRPVDGLNLTDGYISHLAWPEAPRMMALNCKPSIQKANASVVVDIESGRVQSFQILGDVSDDDSAWSDPFTKHPPAIPREPNDPDYYSVNITASYGVLFVNALLAAANRRGAFGYGTGQLKFPENLDDGTFNFRLPGVNADFTSYSMLSQAGHDPQALLDPAALAFHANKTFSVFFQHFASVNVSSLGDGWTYQRIGETLPADLSPAIEQRRSASSTSPASLSDHEVEVEITTRVLMLKVSPVAVWLCIAILSYLIITSVVIVLTEKRYLGGLVRGVKTIADIAVLVAGSQNLLDRLQTNGPREHDHEDLVTKLGWFRDSRGRERWGIELYERGSAVEWLDETRPTGRFGSPHIRKSPSAYT